MTTSPSAGETAPPAPSPIVGVFGAAFNANRELLLIQRADMPLWCLPGGVMSAGESVEQALRRECLEEVGIELRIDRLLGIYSDPERHLFRFRSGVVKHFVTMVFVGT